MIVGNLLYKAPSPDSIDLFKKENILFPFFYVARQFNSNTQ